MTQIYPDSILRWSKVKTRKNKGQQFFRHTPQSLTNGSPETDNFEKSEKSHFFAWFLGEPSVSNFLQTSKRSHQISVAGTFGGRKGFWGQRCAILKAVCHREENLPPKNFLRPISRPANANKESKDHQAVSSCCCFGWWVFWHFIIFYL